MIEILKDFTKFFGVGMIMLVLSMTAYYIAFEIFDCHLYITYALIYLLAILISYILNAKFTFRKEKNLKDMKNFYVVYIFGLLIGLGILAILDNYTSFSKFIITIIQVIPRTIIVFLLSRYYVFKDR